jgi:thiol peroxidase
VLKSESMMTFSIPSAPQNLACAKGKSLEIHKTEVLAKLEASLLKLRTEVAHVPVSTLGKIFKTKYCPSKSESVFIDKSVATNLKSFAFEGQYLVLNIFPSVDTGTCATSVRNFNKEASSLANTSVLCISRDLPFAQARFCGAEGLKNVETLSDFNDNNFGKAYGLDFIDGPLNGLHSRAVVVINKDGNIIYTEQVSEIANEPNYNAVFEALQ